MLLIRIRPLDIWLWVVLLIRTRRLEFRLWGVFLIRNRPFDFCYLVCSGLETAHKIFYCGCVLYSKQFLNF